MKRYYQMEVDGNEADIDIYGDITSWPFLDSDVSAANLSAQLADLDVDAINVNINSYGGEVAEGLAIYNALKKHKAKVRTRCDGFACSIASVIFMAGDERIMNEASLLMIHNAFSWAEGDANALRKMADDLDLITNQSKKIYLANTNIDEGVLTELMDQETFIEPEDALGMGFATSVVPISADHPAQSALKTVFQAVSSDEDKASDPAPEPGVDVEGPDDPKTADGGSEDDVDGVDSDDIDANAGKEGSDDGQDDDEGKDPEQADSGDGDPAADDSAADPDDPDEDQDDPDEESDNGDSADDDKKKDAQEGLKKLFTMLAR